MFTITKPTERDIPGIQEVFYQTWLETYPNKEAGITVEDIEEHFKDRLSSETLEKRKVALLAIMPDNLFLVAKDRDRVIGVCRVVKRDNCNQLQAIYVLPAYQRRGIGAMFWEKALKFIDPKKETIVQVATYNEKAINFYTKLGFVDTGKRFTEESHRMPISKALIPEMEMVLAKSVATMKVEKDWSAYYKITESSPPSKLLVHALEYVSNGRMAVDIGAGALRDTRYLLERGFDVTVVDKSPLVAEVAKKYLDESKEKDFCQRLHVFVSSFEDFVFPENEFDIVSAMYALPFTHPEKFNVVFENIKDSLKKGGIFCGQFFGDRDEWSKNQKMTFQTKSQVENLIRDLEVLFFKEEEKDDKTAGGSIKHWHVFHFIARK